jgi:hypothetical protein
MSARLSVVPDVTRGSPRVSWPGPSPRPCGARAARPPGAKAPGQRPTRPKAGASHPPGRALASVMQADRALQSRGRGGRGKAMPFLIRPARQVLSQGRTHFSGQRLAGSVFCRLPWLQTFLIQPFSIPPLTQADTSAAPAPPANPTPSPRLARNLPRVRPTPPEPANALCRRKSRVGRFWRMPDS